MNELTIHRRRLASILVMMGVFAVIVVIRVFSIGAVEHQDFKARAQAEHWASDTLWAQRGAIRDRNGRPLATTVQQYDISAYGAAIRNPASTASRLAPLLQMGPDEVQKKLEEAQQNPKLTTLIKRAVTYDVGEAIGGLRLAGIYKTNRIARAYPEGNLASSLLGFVGRDQIGLAGIEADFNRELMGSHGKLIYERDPAGGEIPLGYREIIEPSAGQDLVLTIDRYVQSVAEYELDNAIAKNRASGGSIIVMDPLTGEILAMASRPSFNLLELDKVGDLSLLRNRAVTDTYEPGSTFKALTVAAAIDTGAVTPSTSMNDNGLYARNGVSIKNWNGAANGTISVTDILRVSSNVGTIWVAETLGADRFYQYLQRFGFGQKTNVELAGEGLGAYRPNRTPDWSPADLATNSFGQGITVTPLQLIAAEASLINGGKLMRPYIVKEVRDGDTIRRYEPVVVRRTISEETSKTMRSVLNAAAEQGETNLALVPGYQIGGKTGTASIATAQGYTSNLTIASFIGFAPADNPRAIALIKVDEPRTQPWGSLVASPVFSSLMRQTMVYLKVPPTSSRVALP